MRIVVVGAGVVGFHLAEKLSDDHHKITIIDSNSELIQRIDERLNVQAILGNAASPRVLRKAKIGAADLVIAVTDRDETNITVSLLAKHLGAKKIVVRLRNAELSADKELMELYGAQATVNPVIVTAEKIQRLIHNPGSFDVSSFADGKLDLWGYEISKGSPLDGVILKDLKKRFDKLPGLIVAIFRDGEQSIARGDDDLRAEDHIYVLMPEEELKNFRKFVHPESERVEKVVIAGATRLGLEVARRVEQNPQKVRSLIVVEKDRARAEKAAEELNKALVLHGSVTDTSFVSENEIADADYFLSLESDDAENLTNAMLIKKQGVRRVLVRSENDQFLPVFQQTNFGEVVNPRRVTVSDILRVIRRGGVVAVSQVGALGAEAREYEVTESQAVCGKKISDLNLPQDSIIGAIRRTDENGGVEIFTAVGDTKILADDHVIIFALPAAVSEIEKVFTRRRGFLR
ncbi:MAG: Trk system potassium transporter TrkA [Planctomycetes bacterium]|nr:Trk system potassium transporter TrkA [Planctomycetota bacterium]